MKLGKIRLDAANANETFEVFDKTGTRLGVAPRQEVHQGGLWHRSSQVFVFNSQGQLLLQKRAHNKDLYPGLWDYSVGEHLQPGESHLAGAVRGLAEELQITDMDLHPVGEIRWVERVGADFVDREIQQAYSGIYTGPLQLDTEEVACVWYISLQHLRRWMHDYPDDFTPWLLQDLNEFGWFDQS